ncbi:MAG TPA: SRPBCC family protein [Candidatus Dormibacteraeota bacterium]
MHEEEPGLDLILVPAAVDGSSDLVLHTVPPTLVWALDAPGQQKLAETASCNCATFTAELQLENSFPVAAPPDRVFAYLLDVNKVAGCVPGAELSEVVDPSTFKGKVKIKVGPVTVAYNGTARIVDRDDSTHSAAIEAEGRETTGPGSARATARMSVVPDGAGSTVKIVTDYNVAGRVAQFGRGVMEDVSRRLVGEMAACIAANIEAEEPHPATAAGATSEDGPGASTATPAPARAPATAKPVNAIGLLFSVLWARLRRLFGSKS